jgi:hypothetical protein
MHYEYKIFKLHLKIPVNFRLAISSKNILNLTFVIHLSTMTFLPYLGLILSIMAVALIGMAVRVFLVKDGEVRGGCAGKNPMMQEEGVACSMCGAMPTEECKSEEAKA